MAEDQGRRAFLRLAAAAGGAGLLASCSRDSQTSVTGAGASRTASAPGTTPGGSASGVGSAAPTATSSPAPADWTALGRDLSGPLVISSTQAVDRLSFNSLLPGASIQTGGDLNTLDVLNGVNLNSGTGIVVGRLDSDNSRFMATTEDDDLVALMSDGDPLGAQISVWSTEHGNRASLR